jgi:hypothetical protein
MSVSYIDCCMIFFYRVHYALNFYQSTFVVQRNRGERARAVKRSKYFRNIFTFLNKLHTYTNMFTDHTDRCQNTT